MLKTPVVPKIDVAKLDAHPFSTEGSFKSTFLPHKDMRVLSEDERNSILGRTSIGGGQSIFSEDLPVGFGNRQHIAAMNAMTLHDKAVAEGYEGVTPELEHFNPDGFKKSGVFKYAHEVQAAAREADVRITDPGVHHPNYWAIHLHDQLHPDMPKDAEQITASEYNELVDDLTEQYGIRDADYRKRRL